MQQGILLFLAACGVLVAYVVGNIMKVGKVEEQQIFGAKSGWILGLPAAEPKNE